MDRTPRERTLDLPIRAPQARRFRPLLARGAAGRAAPALVAGFALALAFGLTACGPGGAPRRPAAIPVPLAVLADSGGASRLAVPSPERARAWLSRVSRGAPTAVRPSPPGSQALAAPPPEAPPESPPVESAAPALAMDEGLKAPIPRGTATLRLGASRGRSAWVDLDVRIDEAGEVSDAVPVEGTADPVAVAAAVECALAMRFHPALQAGRPVAVWCRQRFAFGRHGARAVPPGSETP